MAARTAASRAAASGSPPTLTWRVSTTCLIGTSAAAPEALLSKRTCAGDRDRSERDWSTARCMLGWAGLGWTGVESSRVEWSWHTYEHAVLCFAAFFDCRHWWWKF